MIIYHIFTNNNDEWTENYKEALKLYKEFKKDYGTARLYEELQDEEGEMIEEDCIKSYGYFPY